MNRAQRQNITTKPTARPTQIIVIPFIAKTFLMDPRVSSLLSRLGGLYRDPSRVDRDASALLKSSVGQHLIPQIAPLVENNGDSHSTLVLQGTIAMHFRGNTYQLLVRVVTYII